MSDESNEEQKPTMTRVERRQRAAADALRTLIRDLVADQFPESSKREDPLDLQLHLRITPASDWSLEFESPVGEQIFPQVEDALSDLNAYQEGAVHDFRERSSVAPHCRPPSATMVFAGYDSMGAPRWQEYAQVLVDAQDAEVDQLYQKKGDVLVRTQSGKSLRSEQLSSYGRASKAYSILAQITIGYLLLPKAFAIKTGQDRLAITFQAVETRDERGKFALRLNTLVGGLLPDEFQDLLQEVKWQWLRHARRSAQEALAGLQEDVERARKRKDTKSLQAAMRSVPRVMGKLAKSMERGDRQQDRRTKHAEERRQQKQRPTHKAMEDAAQARRSQVFWDLTKKTIIVVGAHHRAHVFSVEGKHVTSFSIKPDAVEMRLRTARWRAASDAEWALIDAM